MESTLQSRPGAIGGEISTIWENLADAQTIKKTLDALRARGFKAEFVPNKESAREKVKSLLPDGAQVMTGSSRTLEEIGFTSLLMSGSHPWINLKAQILAEKDREKQAALRREATFADYFLGSVQAVTTAGQLVAGSASGSQLAAYSYGGKNLILVVGTHKITKNLNEALTRLNDYSVSLEDRRMKSLGFPGTYLSKIFIFEREAQRTIHVILVGEKLEF